MTRRSATSDLTHVVLPLLIVLVAAVLVFGLPLLAAVL